MPAKGFFKPIAGIFGFWRGCGANPSGFAV